LGQLPKAKRTPYDRAIQVWEYTGSPLFNQALNWIFFCAAKEGIGVDIVIETPYPFH